MNDQQKIALNKWKRGIRDVDIIDYNFKTDDGSFCGRAMKVVVNGYVVSVYQGEIYWCIKDLLEFVDAAANVTFTQDDRIHNEKGELI